MKAIILAGGFGTRLQGVLGDIPKPMADIAGRPFLEYLLIQLSREGLRDIILAVGYKAGAVKDYFKKGDAWGVRLRYSDEDTPRGTGGAFKKAATTFPDNAYIVMNGDSFFETDITDLAKRHKAMKAKATLAVRHQADMSRYGAVIAGKDHEISRFAEKGEIRGEGLINAGIYCIDGGVTDAIPEGKVSLECDLFPQWAGQGLKAVEGRGFFVDIGVPEALSGLRSHPEALLKSVGLNTNGRNS